MVGTIEARKLNFSLSWSHSKAISSVFYEPKSCSLALIHSDSSISLISQFSPFSVSTLLPQTLIPPLNSDACFVPISSDPKLQGLRDGKDVIFVTAGPHNGRNKVLLRFYVLDKGGKFGVSQVGCSQNGICFDGILGGVVLDVSHGMKVMISGTVNYFVIYSGSMSKLMVFGLRFGGDGRRELRLVKCAVMECQFPVMSICVSFGFLILGEMKGARIFPLRALVKGKVGNRRKSRVVRGKVENSNGEHQVEVDGKLVGRKLKVLNGVIMPLYEGHSFGMNGTRMEHSKLLANVHVHTNADAGDNYHGTVKLSSLKLRQDSSKCGMQFVSFNDIIDDGVKSIDLKILTTKAISIQPVSRQKFLVLNSNGDLHLLHLAKFGSAQMRHLPGTIRVHQLAVFPDILANSPVWISDGLNSVHVFTMPCSDILDNDNSSNDEEMISHCSVTRAIFTSDNIKDMITVAANAVLILGQDCLYAYAFS